MVKLEGMDAIYKAINQLPEQMKPKVIKGIMRDNMKPIARAIKDRAPVRDESSYQGTIYRKRKDGSISTASKVGNLKRSIGVRTFGKEKISAYAGIQHNKNDGWYGFFVERGTKNQPKRPFIAPAAAATVPKAKEDLGNDITNYIVKNGQKLGLDIK